MVPNRLKAVNTKQHHTPVTLGVLPWKSSGFYFNENVELRGYRGGIVGSIQHVESRLPIEGQQIVCLNGMFLRETSG